MIPPHKLEKLPRSQKLRKAAKIAGEAERRLVFSRRIEAGEVEYLCGMTEMLASDGIFSGAAAEALKNSGAVFRKSGAETEDIRRALNTVYHVLMAETGRYASDWDFIESGSALDPSKRRPFPGMQVYLEDIRSPFNVGSMFRAAESFGAEKIWLSPLCADPRHKRAERTAMGCVNIMPWERIESACFGGQEGENAADSPFNGIPLFALETGGIPIDKFHFPSRGVIIAGSEELGVSPEALTAADASLGRVSIPLYGAKGSLNVSVAFGIVMHAWASNLKR